MEYTIKYATTRAEISEWYWRLWRKTLWKIHLTFLVLIIIIAGSLDGHWPIQDYRYLIFGMLVAAGLFIVFVLFPQMMYKPQIRTVSASEAGIQTSIGSKSESVKWAEIKGIETSSEHIVITARKTLSAFLIPRRAFQTEDDRARFLEAVQSWQQGRSETSAAPKS